MNINEHFWFIIDKYNLRGLYNKFILWNVIATVIFEGFYWTLLYFSDAVKSHPEMIQRYATLLIILRFLEAPADRIARRAKRNFHREFVLSNSKYFDGRIANLDKKEVLDFDLVRYTEDINDLNGNYGIYIESIIIRYDVPIKSITLLGVAYNKKFYSLIPLSIVFFVVLKYLYDQKVKEESKLLEPLLDQKSLASRYVINSKNFMVNNEYNEAYIVKVLRGKEDIADQLVELNDMLAYKVQLLNFIVMLCVVLLRLKQLTPGDFLLYFLILYDVRDISTKIEAFYNSKSNHAIMQHRLDSLNAIKVKKINTLREKLPIITIRNINNSVPKLVLNKELKLIQGDKILIQGVSGSGKTTFLNILKGMVETDNINCSPNIENIVGSSYITLANHKGLYSANLYDIITNYQEKPNIELINKSLDIAKIHDRLGKNEFINIEDLSSGERMRLLLARITYNVQYNNYSLLLFDELDENLNDDLAVEIVRNLINVFFDKIILYTSHNEEVKKLFKKKINIKNGEINFNF